MDIRKGLIKVWKVLALLLIAFLIGCSSSKIEQDLENYLNNCNEKLEIGMTLDEVKKVFGFEGTEYMNLTIQGINNKTIVYKDEYFKVVLNFKDDKLTEKEILKTDKN